MQLTELTRTDRAIALMIHERVRRRGHSLAEIARTSGVPKPYLQAVAKAAGINYRNRKPSVEEQQKAIRTVIDRGLTFRQAARATGLSKTAVHRMVQRKRRALADSAGPARFEEQFHVCPKHGRLTLWPCVACMAEAARKNG